MISEEDIKKLFHLARIEPTEEDIAKFPKEIGPVLDYVSQLSEVEGKAEDTELILSQKDAELRKDEAILPSVSEVDALIDAFPEKKDRHLKSKKVFEA